MTDYKHPIEYKVYDSEGDLVLYLYTSESLYDQDWPSFHHEVLDLLEAGEDLRVVESYPW